MNKIELIGTLVKKHDPVKFIRLGKEHTYVTILVSVSDNKNIAINVWDNKIHQLDFFKEGELVVVGINLSSHENPKAEAYYHKVNLKTITKYDQALLY